LVQVQGLQSYLKRRRTIVRRALGKAV
jgi:hypothetical protein